MLSVECIKYNVLVEIGLDFVLIIYAHTTGVFVSISASIWRQKQKRKHGLWDHRCLKKSLKKAKNTIVHLRQQILMKAQSVIFKLTLQIANFFRVKYQYNFARMEKQRELCAYYI